MAKNGCISKKNSTFAAVFFRFLFMMRFILRLVFVLVIFELVACSNNHSLGKLDQIKTIGDRNPDKAIVMLDSLEIGIRDEGEYVKHKYDLLRIRLNDKAYKAPTSDIMIKQLMEYFEKEGSAAEKQEVYFYAGSTYRDLHDTPRALEHFFKSLDYALEYESCDSIMLRNTYSNLTYLYYMVQNYNDAADMALNELNVCRKTKSNLVLPFMHLGSAYLAMDSARQAEVVFDSTYAYIIRKNIAASEQTSLVYLLNGYSELKKMDKAKACRELITTDPLKDFSSFPCMAFAQYYASMGKTDSAAIYCKRILDDGTDIYNMYDAAKLLHRIYTRVGDIRNASLYAGMFVELSDSLDLGKRQEMAATVNNEYQYHLDQRKEQQLRDEKERYKHTLVIVSLVALLLAFVFYALYARRRNKHLKELLRVNSELSEYEEELKAKERELNEKMNQNKTFIKLLHQSEFEEKAEDVIHAIRQSATGRRVMEPADWKQLYQAVDDLYPAFKDRLLKELGSFTEQQMQVCYLMRIGLSKPQIQNMTDLSRATIWRWVKKYDWVLTPDDIQ